MRMGYASLNSKTRTSAVAALAFGLTIFVAFASYAGVDPPTPTPTPTATPTATPTPEYCDYVCDLDKRCSVGGSEPLDQCVAAPGEEVTYYYQVDLAGSNIEVWDDKLGFIGSTSGVTLTRTTTLSETTTNQAWLVASQNGCYCGHCDCIGGNMGDAVTVTVVTPTPTPTPTATPTATPTPTPATCSNSWPETRIVTIAKGQSPTNNPKVSHAITGHIIDPGSLGETAHRIEVCAGTEVHSVVTDATGTPRSTAGGSLTCDAAGCSGVVNVTEKYQSISADGQDKDAITFLPR